MQPDNQIAFSLQRTLLEATEDFSRDIATACSYQPDVANLPVSVIILTNNNESDDYVTFIIILMIVPRSHLWK